MKSASISTLEKELHTLDKQDVVSICIQLAKYRKENKELLNFLLFESANRENYIERILVELEESFFTINRKSSYTTKKGLQKVVRLLNKHVKQNASPQAEIQLRTWFCQKVKKARIDLDMDQVISNLYYREVEKIKTVFFKLHEDLQGDFRSSLEELNILPS